MPRFLTAAVLVVGLGSFITDTGNGQVVEGATSTRDYLEKGTQYFEQRLPDFERETVRGSGYKPFMRYKWLMERRLGPGDDLRPGARWEAWGRLQDLYGEQPRAALPTWFQMGPTNVAGRCLAIDVHPTDGDIVYAGFASSGIWKTTDAGATWTPIGDNLPTLAVGTIEIDTTNPDRIWIGTGEGWGNIDAIHGIGVLVSTDGGDTWGATAYNAFLADARDVFEIVHNPITGTLLVAADNGLFRSEDGGLSFTEVMPSGLWKDVEIKTGSVQTYYACMHAGPGAGFYRSVDDGLTWTLITNGTPTTNIANSRIAQSAADPESVWWLIANTSGTNLGLYRSTDGGDSFSLLNTQNFFGSFGQGWYDLTISVDPEDTNTVFCGGIELWRSLNGGSTFGTIAGNVHVDHHATCWDPSDPNTFWVGTDGGVYRSSNGGTSFASRNSGLVTLQFYAMNNSWPDPNLAFGGTQDNGTWKYTGFPTFTGVLGGDGFECEAGRVDTGKVLAEYYNGNHRRSLNAGASWSSANTGIVEAGPWQTPTHMDYANENILFTAHTNRIYRSTNFGASWTTSFDGNLITGGRSIDQQLNDPDNVVCAAGGRVYVSTDRGVSYTEKAVSGFATANSITDIAVDPNDGDVLLCCLGSYATFVPRVIRSTDRGDTWVDITNNLPGEACQSIEIDHTDSNRYYLGTDLGVYVSFNAGSTWSPLNVGLPHVVCDDVRYHPDGFLRVGTHGRGMWELDLSTLVPSSVEGPTSGAVIQPLTLRVLGNPASDRASVRFGLREAGHARIGLYDISGRQVRSLLDEPVEAQVDFVEFDVADLPAGVYFARLEANGARVTQKLVVEH